MLISKWVHYTLFGAWKKIGMFVCASTWDEFWGGFNVTNILSEIGLSPSPKL